MSSISAEAVPPEPAPDRRRGTAPLAQFFIPAAASLQERRPRTLKHGDTFAVFDHNGDAHEGLGSPEGLYHRDTRHLSRFYLTIDGARPMLLSSTLRDDNASLTSDLTNPDLYDEDGRLLVQHDVIHIRRSRFLWNATCFERLGVRNFDHVPRQLRLEIAFAADFADIFEVRGTRREQRGTIHPPEIDGGRVTLSYTGLDNRRRQTSLVFDPVPAELTGHRAVFVVDVKPSETCNIFIEICCQDEPRVSGPRRNFFTALRAAHRALRLSSSRAASVATSNEIFNEAVRRSVSDINMLITDMPEGPYPYAGIPWFSTVFGRDGLITALEMLWLDPWLARGVLGHLAANQAEVLDPLADAEPGKILHEIRQGEMAELGEVPFRRYYGSVDSTPLFVLLAGAYLDRTGDLETLGRLWPNIKAALAWIDNYGDRDGDGLVEYGRQSKDGLINQGWKDSQDSVFHADGTLAKGPIALAEVQAYVYGAWRAAAQIARKLNQASYATKLELKAETLRRRFDECFFDPELGTYVLALDGDKKPCRVRTSNAGHALFTGIALPERAASVVRTLMASSSFSGWGVRTVATTEARYNPMSYHNGSVWPHDNALIALGLARYGHKAEAARVMQALLDAAVYDEFRRLPELFCGFPRRRKRGPTAYPVACAPQAWAAASPFALLAAVTGIDVDHQQCRLILRNPVLPPAVDEVDLPPIRVGNSSLAVRLTRNGADVTTTVTERTGPAELAIFK